MSLSRDWRPIAQHKGFYGGGAIEYNEKQQSIFGLASDAVQVFSLVKGKPYQVESTIETTGDGVITFAVHPNGESIVTSHRSTLLRQWEESSTTSFGSDDPETEKKWVEVKNWRGHEQCVADIAFDPRGDFLATGGLDRLVKVWDMEGRFVTHNFKGHSAMVTHVKFHPDPKKLWVISISEDADIRVWDMHSNTLVGQLKDHMGKIASLTFYLPPPLPKTKGKGDSSSDDEEEQDEAILITGGRDSIVNLWSMEEMKKIGSISAMECVEGVVVIPQEDRSFTICTAGDKGLIRLWDGKTQKRIVTHKSPHGNGGAISKAFATRYNGQNAIATIGEDQHLIFWSTTLEKQLGRYLCLEDSTVHCQWIGANKDGILMVSGDETPYIMSSNPETPFKVESVLVGHEKPLLAADVRKEDGMIATGGKDHEIRLWTPTGQPRCRLTGHAGDVTSVIFPHKKMIHTGKQYEEVFVSGGADNCIKLWVVPQNDEFYTIEQSRTTRVPHEKDITALAMAPNDKMLASGSLDKKIKIFSFPDLEIVGELIGHRRAIWSLQFSGTDKVLASAAGDGTIRIWNLTDFTAIKSFEGHSGSVLQVRFLGNNQQLMSAGSDGLLKLWNIRTTDCIKTLEGHDDKVWGMDMEQVGYDPTNPELPPARMISGGDRLILWMDCTEETVAKEDGEAAEKAIKDAQIANCIVNKKYGEALTLALDLGKIGELRKILETWAYDGLTCNEADKDNQHEPDLLKEWVDDLTVEQRESLVKDVLVKWITNRRTSQIANILMRYCLPYMGDKSMEGMNLVTDAFTAYGERHLSRWQAISQQTFIVDMILQGTNNSLPQAVTDTAKVLFENADLSPRITKTVIQNDEKIKSVNEAEVKRSEPKKKKRTRSSVEAKQLIRCTLPYSSTESNDFAIENVNEEGEKIENIQPMKKKKRKGTVEATEGDDGLNEKENEDLEKMNMEENETHNDNEILEPIKKKKKKKKILLEDNENL